MSRCTLSCRAYLGSTLILLLASVDAWAAPVSWVPNADGLWQTAANWSSNPSLPGAADDVTINRPGTITVTLSSGDQSIRSLTSQENLVVGDGTALTLSLGAGGGLINGALTISPGARLSISSGSFQANGAVTADSANLFADTGGQFNLPTLTSYSVGGNGSTIQSNGTGSLVNLSGVTSFSPGTFNRTNVYAHEGGTVNLSGVSSITTGAVDAYVRSTGSTINFTNLTTFSGNNSADLKRLRAEGGGVIISPNLTTISAGTHIELSGPTSVLDVADVTSFNELSLLAESGATLSLPAGITSYSANAFGSQFRAFAGGTLNVSNLTSYSVGGNGSMIQSNGTGSLVNLSGVTSFSPGTFNRTNVYAHEGGTVNLSGVSSITTGAVDAYVRSTGSTINFTNLTTFSGNNSADLKRLRAEGGGVIISPNLTTISAGTHIELSGPTSVLDVADVTSFNELSLLAESGATLSLPAGITSYSANAFGSQFRAFAGGTLNVSNLTSYTIGGNGSMIQADGAGSLVNLSGVTSFSPGTFNRTNVYAHEGGTVNLSGVSSITTGAVDAYVRSTGSTINFTNLATFSPNNFADLRRLRAENGGTLRIKSVGTTTVMNASVEVEGTGTIFGDTLQVSTGATLSGNGFIDANYTQLSGGTMRINIGGLTADTEFDQIEIDGNAALAGTLQVLFTNNFVPVFGQSFEILKVNGTLSGAFDPGPVGPLTGGLHWDIIYNPHSVVLEVANFYGDYNGDGVIDAADYVVWRKFRNAAGINQPADGDQNLVVNDLDYDYWRARFNETSGSGAGAADFSRSGVPEPTTLAQWFVGSAVMLVIRRGRLTKNARRC